MKQDSLKQTNPDIEATSTHTTDTLIAAIVERASAQIQRSGSALRLALAESRLAAGSAVSLLGLVVAAAVLALILWLLLCALGGYALWHLGLPVPGAIGVLILIHLIALGCIGLFGKRLAGDLRFDHTRRALKRPTSDEDTE